MRTLPLLLAFLMASSNAHAGWPDFKLDRSHAIFFSPTLKATVGVQQSFPVFWWNFLILDTSSDTGGASGASQATELCHALKALGPNLITRAECGQSLAEIKPLLSSWAQDVVLRKDRPSNPDLQKALNLTLSQASLPMPDPSVTALLREDPLESWREFQKLATERLKIPFPRLNGFFVDSVTHRTLIPIQFAFSPAETGKTEEFLKSISRFGATLIGPHGATTSNEQQIKQDTQVASRIGMGMLLLLGAVLLATGRGKLFLLIPPILVSIGIGALSVILIEGSIHGLTLSFGTGLIGLAVDYGLYASLSKGGRSGQNGAKRAWKANFFGLLTTLAGLLVLMTSSIPLLRQMMIFASVGLVSAFCILYFLIHRFPVFFEIKPFPFAFRSGRLQKAVTVILLLSAAVGILRLRPNLDMNQFNFEDRHTQELSSWLYRSLNMGVPLLEVHEPSQALRLGHLESHWAQNQGIAVENVSRYLPEFEDQEKHLKTWNKLSCEQNQSRLSHDERLFFAPFIQTQLCPLDKAPISITAEPTDRSYLKHLQGSGQWITLWLPSNAPEERKIREHFPKTQSLREIIMTFPQTLEQELKWMAPLSVFLALVLILIYYRNPWRVLVAVIPFFTGLGLISLMTLFFGFQVSFISLIGWVMVFGFSTDYGIFVTNIYVKKERQPADSVWTAVSLAAFSNLAGFAPLLFCHHPVLNHLGTALFWGTMGTYLGTVCGIPAFLETDNPCNDC